MSAQLTRRHFLRNVSAGVTGWGLTPQFSSDAFAAHSPWKAGLAKEGGYEGEGAMIYYGQPGPFAPTVEETIIGKAHDLIRQVRGETS